jgi:benzil reductase ((S)-benzoin forming)
MHYYIITGTSRGLGKALAEEVLKQADTAVLGVCRHATIEHPRYQHQPLDFSDIVAVKNNLHKVFFARPDATSVTLINNAGVVGEIGYIGEHQNEQFEFVFDINVIVPAMLMNTFLSAYGHLTCPRTVLNISSGAAQRPVDGWGAYCASKAALDMLSQVAQKEQDLRGSKVRVHSLAPGIVDTTMQEHIRSADERDFSQAAQFEEYHNSGQLATPVDVAGRIVKWLTLNPAARHAVVLRISELPV